MILDYYIDKKGLNSNEKKVTGYFLEKFLYFNNQKKNNHKFIHNFINFNSNRNNYFSSLFQCFLKIKLEKFKTLTNLNSRINLLKLRMEFSNTNSHQIFRSDENPTKIKSKIYSCLNSLPLFPKKNIKIQFRKMKKLFKKIFFIKTHKAILIYWFRFFLNLKKNKGKSVFEIFNPIQIFRIVQHKIITYLIF